MPLLRHCTERVTSRRCRGMKMLIRGIRVEDMLVDDSWTWTRSNGPLGGRTLGNSLLSWRGCTCLNIFWNAVYCV